MAIVAQMDEQPVQPPPPPPPERPLLRRSRSDRVIAGVAGGIAQHLGLDSTLVRLAWVAIALFGGSGVILYLVAWLIMAEEPSTGTGEAAPPRARSDSNVGAYILGGILIALGGLWLLGPVSIDLFRYIIPAALIAIGVAIIANSSRR